MPREITELLNAWSAGDETALEELVPLVNPPLRRVVRRALRRERPNHSLQTTALIHEVYLKMLGSTPERWGNRSHFFALASRLVRQILVDHARRRRAGKRGGDVARITLDESALASAAPAPDLVSLDEALQALTSFDERKGRVVELRFFGGLDVDETAQVLKVSPQTVKRDWRLAKAWLYRELRSGADAKARPVKS